MLERNVEVRQDFPVRHQRNHFVDVRIRIYIMQTHPDSQLGEAFAQFLHARAVLRSAPFARGVFHVDAVCARVLRDDQQFTNTAFGQLLRFDQHFIDRARNQIAAHRGDDAKRAAVIAALGYLQIRVVFRCELDALRRNQVQMRIVLAWQLCVHGREHARVVLRAADREHVGMRLADHIGALAEAAGDDHLAVLGQCLADRVERFLNGGVDETASVDDDDIGRVVAGHDFVTLHAQLGEDAFGVDQRLGAAETDESDFRSSFGHGFSCVNSRQLVYT